MSTPSRPRSTHLSTYILPEPSNDELLRRVQAQDLLFISGMGGVLPEQEDPSQFQSVLDVSCGSSAWLLGTAQTYPTMTRLVGVNISKDRSEYGRSQAEALQLSDRVTFESMEILRVLDFQTHSFDLVNISFGQSYLRTWDWPSLLSEFVRIARPGGTIRITEMHTFESDYPYFSQFMQLVMQVMHHAGYYFSLGNDGSTSGLVPLLQRLGLSEIQTKLYPLKYNASTPDGQSFVRDFAQTFNTLRPFTQKWLRAPDYDDLYQKMLEEMQDPSFSAIWPLVTIWGITPL